MSTERPRVQAYLDPELYEKLKEFQQERGLKESAALNQVLREYFGLEALNQFLNPSLSMEEVIEKSVDEKLNKFFNDFNVFRVEFKNEVWLQLKTQFNIWNQELHRVSNEKLQEFSDSTFRELNSRLEAVEEICKPIEGLAELSKPMKSVEDELSNKSLSELPRALNLTQLARRLGVVKSVISNRKARPDFEEWSRGKDPEGKAWQCRKEGQWIKFYPVED